MLTPDVTDKDIGRRVVYRDRSGYTVEEGKITSFNPQYVFVLYRGVTSAATRREDLTWAETDKSNVARPDAVP
jgi:hypothetical protein